ncbi:MAG: DHH family phosphoesterase [Holophagaceae bacterium]
MKPWRLRRPLPPGPEPWARLARAADLDPRAARLAWLRGVDTLEALDWRLDPAWSRTTDPFLLPGVGPAVTRIRGAITRGEPILVYGDYDVDGVTACALLLRVLDRLGARADFFIPNRFSDGYGLHLDCIRELREARGPGLMVSVDCGVRSVHEVRVSRDLGVDWIVTDHHALGPELPEASAVVHPHLEGYGNPALSGVGVAFKLAQALLDAAPVPRGPDAAFLDGLLKLVALGTVADMVPLAGENATLVKRGLQALAGANAPGVAALLRAARIEGGPVRAQDIAFGVAPRLNAVGRMGGAEDAVRLLLARDAAEAERLMARVEALNAERRGIQRDLVDSLAPPDGAAFDLVVDPSAHKGVLGIVAGQRMRRSGRPTAVCTVQDGLAQCSLRAPEGFDLGPLLDLARPFLASGGGHRAAAGMTFEVARLAFVRQALLRGAEAQAVAAGPAVLGVDGARLDVIPGPDDLARLEPFGQGFPPPVVALSGLLEGPPRRFGAGHLKLGLQGEAEPLTWFSPPEETGALGPGAPLRVAVSPQDHPRWGRGWIVEGPLGEPFEEAP